MTMISIIGGGRWARTIATVLSQLPNAPHKVLLYSRRNSKGVAAWIAEKGLEGRLSVTPQWPDLGTARPAGAIIASSVADHEAAASAVLGAGIPVLIEKPVAIPRAAVQRLADLAASNETFLAASHVFLFARYVDAFATRIENMGRLKRVTVEWMDGSADIRHGEIKSYDPRVTVFDDVLPHIVPLVFRLTGCPLRLQSLDVRRGGADVLIQAQAGEAAVSITMARDGTERRRTIAAETEMGLGRLAFSREPGVIDTPDETSRNGDPLWETELKPLGAMLTAFLAAVDGAALDENLSVAKALESAAFADTARAHYAPRQAQWLMKDFPVAPDVERAYALQELGLSTRLDRPLHPQEVQVLLEGARDIAG
jgi:predicted dehydrogenase